MAVEDKAVMNCLDLSVIRDLDAEYGGDRKQLVYQVARYYGSLGWSILPAAYGSKILPGKETMIRRGYKSPFKYTDGSADLTKIDQWFNPTDGEFAGFNIALVCGRVVSAVDLDIDNAGNGHENYLNQFGPLPDTGPAQRTPGGGYHFVFQHREGFKSSTGIIDHVDTRGAKRDTGEPASHIVVYPSTITVAGAPVMYKWDRGGPLPPAPEALLKMLNKIVKIKEKPKAGRGNENVEDEDRSRKVSIEDLTEALSYLVDDSEAYNDWLHIGMAIHWHAQIGDIDEREGFAVWNEWSTKVPKYPGEQPLWEKWKSFTHNPSSPITAGTIFQRAYPKGYIRSGFSSPHMRENLRRSEKGIPLNTNANVWVLLNSPEFMKQFGGALRYDRFKDVVTAGKRTFINHDFVDISVWMSGSWMVERGPDTLRTFCQQVARNNEFDSLADWVNGLKWDGVKRIDEGLSKALRVTTTYDRAAIARWMVGGIARALKPGCTATHMLVLLGAQGIGKSRFFHAMSPFEDWFSDSTHFKFSGNASVRDEETKLAGRWIIEVAEFEGHYKSESTAIKNFITNQVPLVVKKYEPDPTHLPRRCIFGASANTKEMFNDPTGARRFAVLDIGSSKIDVAWVEANRDQLWAEAAQLYRDGMKWWFDESETLLQSEANNNYVMTHAWDDAITEFIFDKSRFSSQDVLAALRVPLDKVQQRDWRHVNAYLEKKKFEKKRCKVTGRKSTIDLWVNPNKDIDKEFVGKKYLFPDADENAEY
jgi:hypothetical protein